MVTTSALSGMCEGIFKAFRVFGCGVAPGFAEQVVELGGRHLEAAGKPGTHPRLRFSVAGFPARDCGAVNAQLLGELLLAETDRLTLGGEPTSLSGHSDLLAKCSRRA